MIEDDSELLKGSKNDEDIISQYNIDKKRHHHHDAKSGRKRELTPKNKNIQDIIK